MTNSPPTISEPPVMTTECKSEMQWFVMRDLKRPNAKLPAYKQLSEAGFNVFTPLISKIITQKGRKVRIEVPIVRDLLFVFSEKETLDKIVAHTETLQYRFVKGAPPGTPMTVPTKEMERFMSAVAYVKTPKYYSPEEITPDMHGATIRMVCEGPINGVEGKLLKIRGARKKRLLIEIPGLLAATIEINKSDYIELLEPRK